MSERIFLYVRHADVDSYEAIGWVSLHCLGDTHHGRWSELMEWRGQDREHPISPPEAQL